MPELKPLVWQHCDLAFTLNGFAITVITRTQYFAPTKKRQTPNKATKFLDFNNFGVFKTTQDSQASFGWVLDIETKISMPENSQIREQCD